MLHTMVKEGHAMLHAEGTITDIMADLTVLVRNIYDKLDDGFPQEVFKQFVEELLPKIAFVDEEELEKVFNEQIEKTKDANAEKVAEVLGNDIMKKLDELMELLK